MFYEIGGPMLEWQYQEAANKDLAQQGYGPENFTIELENEQGQVTHCAAFMPMDSGLYAAMSLLVKKYQGEWVLPPKPALAVQLGDYQRQLVRALLAIKLKIKRR